jgi:hypothetical protein
MRGGFIRGFSVDVYGGNVPHRDEEPASFVRAADEIGCDLSWDLVTIKVVEAGNGDLLPSFQNDVAVDQVYEFHVDRHGNTCGYWRKFT